MNQKNIVLEKLIVALVAISIALLVALTIGSQFSSLVVGAIVLLYHYSKKKNNIFSLNITGWSIHSKGYLEHIYNSLHSNCIQTRGQLLIKAWKYPKDFFESFLKRNGIE